MGITYQEPELHRTVLRSSTRSARRSFRTINWARSVHGRQLRRKEAMVLRLFLGSISACLMLFALARTVLAGHPSNPDNRWTGPRPEGCPLFYDPVHDIHGNNYGNACMAAQQNVRITWDGISPA